MSELSGFLGMVLVEERIETLVPWYSYYLSEFHGNCRSEHVE